MVYKNKTKPNKIEEKGPAFGYDNIKKLNGRASKRSRIDAGSLQRSAMALAH